MYDPHFKGVFHLSSKYLKGVVSSSNGNILQRMFKTSILGTTHILVFPRNHRFFESFNRKIQQAVAVGFIDQFADDFKDITNKKRFLHLKLVEEKPMNLEHLEAALFIWMVSLVFPIAAFIAEWIFRIKDFIVFHSTFAAYIKILENNTSKRDRKMQKAMKTIKTEKRALDDFQHTKITICLNSGELTKTNEDQIVVIDL